ncbi:hypothetical protein BDZ45DRAFT_224391 [Acephala macrosclerotiorum]|nr:hypothetical protein BDZ45DRAFT_224391 [Acephala macrosclerotiorum]
MPPLADRSHQLEFATHFANQASHFIEVIVLHLRSSQYFLPEINISLLALQIERQILAILFIAIFTTQVSLLSFLSVTTSPHSSLLGQEKQSLSQLLHLRSQNPRLIHLPISRKDKVLLGLTVNPVPVVGLDQFAA